MIVIDERHLHALLTDYIYYYNVDRPHRSLDLQSPVLRAPSRDGPIVRRPVLGGLHNVYSRAA
ncbi:MAG: transposase [Candidatus Dormibacteria bacterium]